jgi:predicted ATPase
MVGRRAEIATLLACLRSARSGGGSFVGLWGEAGIGKSRLVFELAQQARELGFGVLSGHCRTLDEQSTLQPVSQLVLAALEIPTDVEDPQQALRQLDRYLAPTLAEYLPAFVTLLGGVHPAVIRLPDEKRLAFFAEALGVLFAHRAKERPQLLVVEDLHWIDPASAAILEQTLPRLRDSPILFLSVYRPGFEPRWRDATAWTEIELPALDAREQADLIRLRLARRCAR